ncbi:hypothetical protein RB213_012776 [Colletotrichum asianum]
MTYSRVQRRAREFNDRLLRFYGKGVHFPPGPCLGSDKFARMAMRLLHLEPSEAFPKPDITGFKLQLVDLIHDTWAVAGRYKDVEFNSFSFWSTVLDRASSFRFCDPVLREEISKHGRSVKYAIMRIVNTYLKARRNYIQLGGEDPINDSWDHLGIRPVLSLLDSLERYDTPRMRNKRRNRRRLRNDNDSPPQISQFDASLTAHGTTGGNSPHSENVEAA